MTMDQQNQSSTITPAGIIDNPLGESSSDNASPNITGALNMLDRTWLICSYRYLNTKNLPLTPLKTNARRQMNDEFIRM